jgi:hypothetical protein
MATLQTDHKNLPRVHEGDWTVPKLVALLLFVLGAFFCFIYYVSP